MRLRKLTILCIAAAACVSCTKEAQESAYAAQEALIEKFAASKPDARISYSGGSTRVTLNEGDGVELNARGSARITYAGYNFKSGSISASGLFATNSSETAAASGWNLTDGGVLTGPVELSLTDKDLLDGLRNGLIGVREGEECYILFSGKYAFGKSKVGNIPPNAPLAFHIWVESIQN